MMKILYRTANTVARRVGWKTLEKWSYLRWFRWWMRKDPVMGYWRFSTEYLGIGEILTEADA